MFNVKQVEKLRIKIGPYASNKSDGTNGAFIIHRKRRELYCIVSDGMGWEHVSVSYKNTPTWSDMNYIKNLFWEEEDAVIQIHPPLSEYVNCHPNCLHLWRCIDYPIILPPSFLVGLK